ncbi:hypothetical protein DSECCO2_437940 [anaerobic digester metagenome]
MPGDDVDIGTECPEYVGKLRRHHATADDDHATRKFFHIGERLVGVDPGEIGAGDIGDRRPRPRGCKDRVGPNLFVIDKDPVPLQPAFGAVDDIDSRPAGLSVEDRGEFLLDIAHSPYDRGVRDGRDRVEDPEILLGSGVLDESGDIV